MDPAARTAPLFIGPITPSTAGSSAIRWATRVLFSGTPSSSPMTTSTFTPPMPPAAFSSSTAILTALATRSPFSAPRPENGPTTPILIGPCTAGCAPTDPLIATAAAVTAMSQRLVMGTISFRWNRFVHRGTGELSRGSRRTLVAGPAEGVRAGSATSRAGA